MIYPFSMFCVQDWGAALTEKGESPHNDIRYERSAEIGRNLGRGGETLRRMQKRRPVCGAALREFERG